MCIIHWVLLTIHHRRSTPCQYNNGWSGISCSAVASAGDKDLLTITSKHWLILFCANDDQSPADLRHCRALLIFHRWLLFPLTTKAHSSWSKKKNLMKLWVFQDFKCPQRKRLKEILIRWREWASMGLVLLSRCALLDWLLKPLNLLQRKSSTKIDGNNQYVPAALFTSQKLYAFIIPSLSHSYLFFFSYLNPWLSSFLPFSPLSPPPCHPTSPCSPPPGRTGQSVSRRRPPVPYSTHGHLGCVSSRQLGASGTVGTGQAFPGETQNVASILCITQYPYFYSIEGILTLYTQCSLIRQQQSFIIHVVVVPLLLYTNTIVIGIMLDLIHRPFVSPSVDVQPSLQ